MAAALFCRISATSCIAFFSFALNQIQVRLVRDLVFVLWRVRIPAP